jgi:hypothetical protein
LLVIVLDDPSVMEPQVWRQPRLATASNPEIMMAHGGKDG